MKMLHISHERTLLWLFNDIISEKNIYVLMVKLGCKNRSYCVKNSTATGFLTGTKKMFANRTIRLEYNPRVSTGNFPDHPDFIQWPKWPMEIAYKNGLKSLNGLC